MVRVLAFALAGLIVFWSALGRAQIREPGAHLHYGVEVEPQLTLKLFHVPGEASGLGPGIRFSVPILKDGPIGAWNNSLVIGAGFNWNYYQENCGVYFWEDSTLPPRGPQRASFVKPCKAHQFIVPVVVQWNFYMSRFLTLFAEPGLSLQHERRSGDGWCDGSPCSAKDHETKLPFVFWAGARMMMSDSVALTIRLGTPYVSTGVSLFF
jgi:hypothetical protein